MSNFGGSGNIFLDFIQKRHYPVFVKVVIEKKAAKYLESLDAVMKQRIEQALKDLAKEPAIETNLTAEEKKWVQEGRKHYKEHPEDFVPLTLS